MDKKNLIPGDRWSSIGDAVKDAIGPKKRKGRTVPKPKGTPSALKDKSLEDLEEIIEKGLPEIRAAEKAKKIIEKRRKGGAAPKSKEKHEPLTVLLEPRQIKDIKVLAVEKGITVSRLMRDVIDGKIKL